MKIQALKEIFGLDAKNRLSRTHEKSIEGAIACLETFYYSFNNKDMDVFRNIWYMDSLIQLNNPLGGSLRGIAPIEALYSRIFDGPADVWVAFSDIVCYQSGKIVVFTGTETGEFSSSEEQIPLKFRTTRVFGYAKDDQRWCQLHHHGSIGEADLLQQYQNAVNSEASVDF